MSERKRLVILDTHAVLHRAYHALPDFSSNKGEPTGALYGLVTMLVRIVSDLKPDYIAAAFDLPGPTYRHEAYDQYKATRAKTEDALIAQIKRSRDVLAAFGVPLYDAAGFEADDVIGTIVEQMQPSEEVDLIIASGDMDTLQLVRDDRVRVFTMRKGLTDIALYNEEAVRTKFGFGPERIPDLKGIMGDNSDNIKGVPGVGEGSALKLIQAYDSVEGIYEALKEQGVEAVAKEAGIQKRYAQMVADHEEDAVFSKMLAQIRRDAPIEFVLPEQTWREAADPKRAMDLLAELDFRSLTPRVKAMFAQGTSGEQAVLDLPEEAPQVVDPERLEEAALAVWVLDTSVAQPELEDILRAGKSQDFDEAFENIKKEIAARELTFVYEQIELPLRPVLRRMESRGVRIDRAFLTELSERYHKELDAIAARVFEVVGEEFNLNSPKQLGVVLFDKLGLAAKNQKKTASGARSTRESELEKLRDAHPVIADILAHRELQKLLSTYIDTIPQVLDGEDRLHTHFIQTGAATGRLASQNPSVQNIPIKTELGRAIRNAFVASEGMRLVSFDYSQIELRIAAILSGDEGLISIFKEGRDVHSEVAARVFHVQPGEVSYEQRRAAKVINFGILYGMGVTSLQQSLGTTRAEAQQFYNQYFEAFPRLAAFLDETIAQAAKLGYTETLFGRRRYFDGIKSPIPYVRAAAERMAINAPIQGTATADIPKLAMICIDRFLQERGGGYLLLQVHDELLFELEEDKVAEYEAVLREMMEGVLSDEQRRGVPILVDGKVGPNWGEMEKL